MKAVALPIAFVLFGCLFVPSLSQDYRCDLPRGPMRTIEQCVVEKSPEVLREAYFKFINCLEVDSMVDALDVVCNEIAQGLDPEQVQARFRRCEPSLIGIGGIPDEIIEEGNRAEKECEKLYGFSPFSE
uniref:Uncharacterized protein n=1 Tax=Pandinus cavimanus TaxID=217261 RepID=H2CYR0_PANCV|nr:hypothetical protein [Pandinus cavimanus]